MLDKQICKCIGQPYNSSSCTLNAIQGVSDVLLNLLKKTSAMIQSAASVLITGESGTGKSLFARALHYSKCSNKINAPFIVRSVSGIAGAFSMHDAFGYEDDSLTSTFRSGKKGLFELANGGSIFLDEIADFPEELQVILLRILEENEVYHLGGTKKYRSNVRVIAATNKNLLQLVNEGKFREDLYYRINVCSIHIPALRERPEDIIPTAIHILHKLALHYKVKRYSLGSAAMKELVKYSWPGNVRELENVLTREVLHLPPGETIIRSINMDMLCVPYTNISERTHEVLRDIEEDYHRIKPLKEVEREVIIQALIKLKGNRNKTAQSLGISRNTLYKKIEQYNIHY